MFWWRGVFPAEGAEAAADPVPSISSRQNLSYSTQLYHSLTQAKRQSMHVLMQAHSLLWDDPIAIPWSKSVSRWLRAAPRRSASQALQGYCWHDEPQNLAWPSIETVLTSDTPSLHGWWKQCWNSFPVAGGIGCLCSPLLLPSSRTSHSTPQGSFRHMLDVSGSLTFCCHSVLPLVINAIFS